MQLVRTNKVFGFLLYVALFVGRNKLWRNRCINDIKKCLCSHLACHIAYQIADKSLGNSSIYTIHRHVVAIICGPTQCQLRQIACTYNNGILLISHIHKNLGALACLRILVGNIVNSSIVVNIAEVLGNSLSNANLADGNTKSLHKLKGVVISAIGGSETRHSYTDDSLAVET